jgi:hypothetical protein
MAFLKNMFDRIILNFSLGRYAEEIKLFCCHGSKEVTKLPSFRMLNAKMKKFHTKIYES